MNNQDFLNQETDKRVRRIIRENDDRFTDACMDTIDRQLDQIIPGLIDNYVHDQTFDDLVAKKIQATVNHYLNDEFHYDSYDRKIEGERAQALVKKFHQDYFDTPQFEQQINHKIEQSQDIIDKKIVACLRHYLNSTKFDRIINRQLDPLVERIVTDYLAQDENQAKMQTIVEKQLEKTLKKVKFNF